MAMTTYGQNLYVDIITKRVTTVPDLWIVLVNETIWPTAPEAFNYTEQTPRFPLGMGTASWSVVGDGLRQYAGDPDLYVDEGVWWGTVSSWAIMNTAEPGTGYVLFYGSTDNLNLDGPLIVSFQDLVLEVPA